VEILFDARDEMPINNEKMQQSLKAERLDCLKRQDALQAFIRKRLLFSKRSLLQDLI